ncbi:MAG TPA: exopolysaccharide biosynthesis protein [Stellaceae bacterium]|nr:exopolysaccharide biosynthesis protein [Stellaceae bacterium]
MTPAGTETRGRISAALALILVSHTTERISVGELLDALADHGFGLLILVPALFNAIPGPHIPGFSLPFAIALVVLGAQLAMGWSSPWVPRRVRRWSVTSTGYARFLNRILPTIRKAEGWLRPRPSWLTDPIGTRIIGVAVILQSVVLALPIPFGNGAIAYALIVLALGLMEEDSRALGLGLLFGILALVWNAALVAGGALAILELLG